MLDDGEASTMDEWTSDELDVSAEEVEADIIEEDSAEDEIADDAGGPRGTSIVWARLAIVVHWELAPA